MSHRLIGNILILLTTFFIIISPTLAVLIWPDIPVDWFLSLTLLKGSVLGAASLIFFNILININKRVYLNLIWIVLAMIVASSWIYMRAMA
ncbi:hypothetical protein PM10SUCC1_03040 [Propionigenium maris DSM 9537]|uniref:Uncharacterized protein n=1 Tax=Propionigenium maris DSM 9537 TaxID=1123000 RepID=A0A9W6GGE8_9FUSO|nr:hypothetical protein [Propionigenium maris]GLI54789.1 hypothetical protein PM10SUCC1_03040 [Propionigenium maris DSM 9537]